MLVHDRPSAWHPQWGQSPHPTVKPVALMEYLIKRVTPVGGHVLDPFIGSGSADLVVSYARKLVTGLSGGVFGYLDSVLERHSFDEFGELI